MFPASLSRSTPTGPPGTYAPLPGTTVTDDIVESPVPATVNMVSTTPDTRNPDSWVAVPEPAGELKCGNCFCPGPRSRDFAVTGNMVCNDCFDLSESPYWKRTT